MRCLGRSGCVGTGGRPWFPWAGGLLLVLVLGAELFFWLQSLRSQGEVQDAKWLPKRKGGAFVYVCGCVVSLEQGFLILVGAEGRNTRSAQAEVTPPSRGWQEVWLGMGGRARR